MNRSLRKPKEKSQFEQDLNDFCLANQMFASAYYAPDIHGKYEIDEIMKEYDMLSQSEREEYWQEFKKINEGIN